MFKKARNFLLILLSITIINSQAANISIDELRVLKETLHNASVYMQKEAQYEDIAIFIGTTKSGKSTLINYLLGNPLIADRERPGRPITIKKADNSSGPAIGTKSTSETKIPSRWSSKQFPNMSLWDSPGFNDNRGPRQDIANAFYLYQLLQKVKSLRIVLVVDITAIQQDNINAFMEVLQALENLMKDRMRDCFASISVIFSKAVKYYYGVEVNKAFIKDILKENILESEDINVSPVSRDFVRFLIENEKNIGIFGRVNKPGNVTSDIGVDVLPAILNSVPVLKNIVQEMNPTISTSSNSHLLNAREVLFSKKNIEDLQNIVSSAIDSKVFYYNSVNKEQMQSEISQFKQEVNSFENELYNALDNCERLHEKIEILQGIVPDITDQLEKHGLNEKIMLKQFIDRVLKLKEKSLMDLSLDAILSSSISKIQHITCSEVQEGLKLQVTGKVISLYDIYIDQCGTHVKYLEIFSTDKVIMNVDLELTGREMQVTIIAPVWKIEGDRQIILNGKDGIDPEERRAEDGAINGERNGVDGLAGLPGGPAGSFQGIATQILNGEQLSILANGGKGGKGQNGGNGANGQDGIGAENEEECPPTSELKKSTGYQVLNWVNPLIGLLHPSNIGDRFQMKNGNPGERGGNGGNGGAGGLGGYKGNVTLLELSKNVSKTSVRIFTEQGNSGEQGYGGLSGKGGKYANDQITKCICHDLIACTFQSNTPVVKDNPTFTISGLTGERGKSTKMIKMRKIVRFHQNLSQSINEYKTYANSYHLKSIHRQEELNVFRDLLNARKEITELLIKVSEDQQRIKRGSRDDRLILF